MTRGDAPVKLVAVKETLGPSADGEAEPAPDGERGQAAESDAEADGDGEADGEADGALEAELPKLTLRQLAIHVGLFLAACVTTYSFGGAWFSATLMSILVCHEFGHYLVARWHGVPVSLPYFIPLPPQVSLGTLGAVIRMPQAIREPHRLFDVGVAGPLAGVAVALPLLGLGLSWSELGPVPPGNILEGNSLLYLAFKLAVFGRYLPADGIDVQLHPMAFAAWVGLLVTMINLIPIGQLDGGHLARAVLGGRHEQWSRRLHVVMPALGVALASIMFALALEHGLSPGAALRYASYGGLPWFTWSLLLLLMRRSAGEYHPAVDDIALDPARRRLAVGVAILFLLIFTPVPFRPPL